MSVAENDPDRIAYGRPNLAFVFGGFPSAVLEEVTVATRGFRPLPAAGGVLTAPILTAGAVAALWNPSGDPRLKEPKREPVEPEELEYVIPQVGGLQTVTVGGSPPPTGVTTAAAGGSSPLPQWSRILEGKYSPDMWDRLARFGITRMMLQQLKKRLARSLPRVAKTIERLLRESRTDASPSVPRSVAVGAEYPALHTYGTSQDLSTAADQAQLAGAAYELRQPVRTAAGATAAARTSATSRSIAARPIVRPTLMQALRPAMSARSPGALRASVLDNILTAQPQLMQLAQSLQQAKPTKKGDCSCDEEKPKQQRKKRQPRVECYRGTYQQRRKGIVYHRKEKIPCQ